MGAFKKGQALFLYFMAYAVIGWIYEVFLEVVVYPLGIFKSEDFVWAVSSSVWLWCGYHFAGASAIEKETDYPWKNQCHTYTGVFRNCGFDNGLELLTSYIMEWTTGGWLWDYDRFAWNFQGRIALNPSIRFGIGGMFFLYCVQPLLEKADGVLTEKTRSLLSGSLFVLICVDFLYHVFLKV